MGAMLEMMQRMMGKEPGDQKKGKKGGEKGGDGLTGDSDAPAEAVTGDASGESEVRRVPKSAGRVGENLPQEFQRALDAYNKRKP